MPSAEKIAAGWSSRKQRHEEDDLKGFGLPKHVQEAILDVEANSHRIATNVARAEALWEAQPDHPLALEPGNHPQTTWAQRFEEVDGEIVEILKESHDTPVKLIYRPDLTPPGAEDPLAALEASFRADDEQ
jgi:hypothetical protein